MGINKDTVIEYFKGVRSEWGKIVWPEKQQIVSDFFWVVVICTIFTLLIYVLDKGFNWILGYLPPKY